MTVNDRSGRGNRLVDFQMQQNFASLGACTHDSLIVQTDKRKILKGEITFTAHCGGTKDIIRRNSIRYVSPIPIHIFSSPQFLADGNDLLLDSLSRSRFEERLCWTRRTFGHSTMRD